MSGAIFVIEQDRPGGPSTGTAGQARNDLWLGRLIHFIPNSPTGNVSYFWELLDYPPTSAAIIEDATTAAPYITALVFGSYRVRCTVNGGGPGNISTLICQCRYDINGNLLRAGRALPAFGENEGEDNYGGQLRGYAQTFETMEDDTRSRLESLEALAWGSFDANDPSYQIDDGSSFVRFRLLRAGDITITLPQFPLEGAEFIFKDVLGQAGANTYQIDAWSGMTIDGDPSVALTVRQALHVVYHSNNWEIV
jgi:hypothetical protein